MRILILIEIPVHLGCGEMSETKSRLVFSFFTVTSAIGVWLCWTWFRSESFLFLLAFLSPAGVIVFGAPVLYPALLRRLEEDFEHIKKHNRLNPDLSSEEMRQRHLLGVIWAAGLVTGAIHWVLLSR